MRLVVVRVVAGRRGNCVGSEGGLRRHHRAYLVDLVSRGFSKLACTDAKWITNAFVQRWNRHRGPALPRPPRTARRGSGAGEKLERVGKHLRPLTPSFQGGWWAA